MATFDVSTHRLVPKHELLSDDQKQHLLEQYNIVLAALPEIDNKDPAVMKCKAKIDDVIRITRKSLTAGTTIFYRRVVGNE